MRLNPLVWGAALLSSLALATSRQCQGARYERKPRLFILTDISNEPDDQMSLVRLLTYANELDIVGIAATTSTWLRNKTDPETIRTVIGGYGDVVDNLNANVPDEAPYPSAEELASRVSSGHPVYGLISLNLSLSSAAEALVDGADASTPEDPLWIGVWGGAAVLAEALQHVTQTREQDAVDAFVDKLRVYSISDQDDAGPWIRDGFPRLSMVVSLHGFSEYAQPTWNGISGEQLRRFDGGGPDSSLVSNDWLQRHVRVGRLGAAHYPNWTYIMEGDTPSFLPLVQNGLGDVDNPQWGSWGGRYSRLDASGRHAVYSDCADYVQGLSGDTYLSRFATIWRWRPDYQYDFAARMQWTLDGDAAANNHQPVAVVNGTCGVAAWEMTFRYGDDIVLDASESWDPDEGDELSFTWFHYREAGGREVEGFDIPLISEDMDIELLNEAGSRVRVKPIKRQSEVRFLS